MPRSAAPGAWGLPADEPAEIAVDARQACRLCRDIGRRRVRQRSQDACASLAERRCSREVKPDKLRCVEIEPRHLSLIDLERGDCRYPYGGDEEGEAITFCGHPRRPGSSYCTPHFHLSRNPDRPPEPSRARPRSHRGSGLKAAAASTISSRRRASWTLAIHRMLHDVIPADFPINES